MNDMTIHPQARAIMDRIAASGEPPLETLPPQEARRFADARVGNSGLPHAEMHAVRDLSAPGPAGPIPLRLYRPSDDRDLPLVMFFHGGGFMVANLDTHDALCRLIAARTGAALIAVDYRLAPENRFPAAPEDCLAATRWALTQGDMLDYDAAHFALAGESSGGNLTAVVAQQLHRGGDAQPAVQVMIYAMFDGSTDSESYRRFAEGFFFTRSKSEYFLSHYIGSPDDLDDPRMSPLRAESLTGLPPALIVTAGLDPLLSEAEAYAERLRAAGVAVDYRCFEGWPHGFLFWGETDAAIEAIDLTCATLRRHLGSSAIG